MYIKVCIKSGWKVKTLTKPYFSSSSQPLVEVEHHNLQIFIIESYFEILNPEP